VGCDLAVAADEAQFGLSEINWGILPAGNVTKAVAMTMNWRQGLYYVMTGATFDGKQAAELGLVNESVPLSRLKKRVREICDVLLAKDPDVLKAAKDCFKRVRDLPLDVSEDYITSKLEQMFHINGMQARNEGMSQFLDKKGLKPGLATAKFSKARPKGAKAKA
jgi:trans-feruloyl-CoA hydratase/vanillin synthase